MKRLKRVFTALVLVMSFLLLSVQSLNANAVVDEQSVTLNIIYDCDGVKIPNAGFELYYVADIDDSYRFTLAGDFKGYPVDVNTGSENYQSLAQTLYGYVQLDNVSPVENGKTNADGELTFSSTSNNLAQGMYLVVADEAVVENYKYTADPYIVSLPHFDLETDSFEYSVTSYPKGEREELETDTDSDTDNTDTDTSTDTSISKSVLKKWSDEGFENERPESVEVNLLKDGVLYDTVELNEKNNWYHVWYDLDENSDWTVAETPVDGYTVVVASEGSTFIVTNTNNHSDTDSESNTSESNSSESSTPSTAVSTPSSPSAPSLPQTGTLWWAVPILLVLGLAFLFIGCVIRRGSSDEE